MRALGGRRPRLLLAVGASLVVGLAASPAPASAGSYTLSLSGGQLCPLGFFQTSAGSAQAFQSFCQTGAVTLQSSPAGASNGDRLTWQIDSPDPALTIGAVTPVNTTVAGINDGGKWGGGSFWSGGGQTWSATQVPSSGAIDSSYYGVQILCGGSCPNDDNAHDIVLGGLQVTVNEAEAPSLSAQGSNNLFTQTSGWVWNEPGASWPVTLLASDPSGVCLMAVSADGIRTTSPAETENPAAWQQCPSGWSWSSNVDTRASVPASGQLLVGIAATNAAGNSTEQSATVNVDNITPSISLTPVNDDDPTRWSVNHSVTLRVAASAGPSGVSGVTCSDAADGATSPLTLSADPSVAGDHDVTVDGNGAHDVSCTVANNAVNPSGAHNSASATQLVDIDEQPPSLSFEPATPSDPTQVVVDVSDGESAVASGSLEIAPAGSSSWTPIPTTFAANDSGGGQLTGVIPDASLPKGSYVVQASATSQVGNSATTTENVTLPLRSPTTSIASFAKVANALRLKKVKERILVGWHWIKKKEHGRTVKVEAGGHFTTITVIKRVEKCSVRRVKVAKHKWKLKRICRRPHLQYKSKLVLGHGRTTALYGELLTSQGVAISDQTVDIRTAANNGHGRYSKATVARTNADGGWKIRLPAGPSRIVKVTYGGSETQLPARSFARLFVPAKIRIWAAPYRLPWRDATTISGKLLGGYVPRDGVAMRLLIKLPGRRQLYAPAAFRTTKTGSFSIAWSWGRGSGVGAYPFSVATTATESDYPFTAARSRAVKITFGVPTPRRPRKHRR